MKKNKKKKTKTVLCKKCGCVKTNAINGICCICKLEYPADAVEWLTQWIEKKEWCHEKD